MNMQVTEYVVKKTLGKKITVKDKWGGFSSNETGAEVIVTFLPFEGMIDPYVANEEVKKYLNDLIKDTKTDEPAWLSGEQDEKSA